VSCPDPCIVTIVVEDFFETAHQLESRGEPFAVATVISVQGSGSAKPGSKVIIDKDGQVVLGWVGGGCAESTVCHEALESMSDNKVRVIDVDLTDEIFGMPCGGMMQVAIEPVLPKPDLVIAGHGRIAQTLAQMGHLIGFSVTVADPGAAAKDFPTADHVYATGLTSAEIELKPGSYVVVATHHKGDHLSLKKAIDSQAGYVALVASRTRSQLIVEYLEAAGMQREDVAKVRSPAGLSLGAETPEEIALSIISEVVAVRRGGSGRPMAENAAVRQLEANLDQSNHDLAVSTLSATVSGESKVS
jgi:xanthine dehydrogenase accessory factor